MERNQSQMKPTGKSSFNPANTIVKDSAARLGLGMSGPQPYGSGKAKRFFPPQYTKTTGTVQGIDRIGRNPKFPPSKVK